ncbi:MULTISPECIES: mycofactocin precursor MftA [unclassified Streptomyces]|uniref:mycofactocin precursor MftA n=1 Tax=unclassified Streptomyces TaxID=2593676 RepID=UPI002E177584|nr:MULTISPECIES: mycofactocin precursor MftA [unclassified Streptomyces]
MNEQLEATAAPEAPAASTASTASAASAASAASTDEPLIEADDLVEEVSIDGMCGVY